MTERAGQATVIDSTAIRRILIVEDDLGVQAALTIALEDDFLVRAASTGAEALQRLADTSPDLILLDVQLPDLNGAMVLRAVRAWSPSCPVFVVTACEESETLRELMSLRVDAFFWKPFDIGTLLERIAATLEIPTESNRLPMQSDRGAVGRHVARAIDYLSRHYAAHVTVETVAAAIGVSASHLAHRFALETGTTTRQYLTKIRVGVAKRLLTETEEKLDTIADAAGFCDASHLTRVFREHVGCPPGTYRRLRAGRAVASRGDGWHAF